MADRKRIGVKLPAGYDPLDMELKRQIHPQATEKNRIHETRGRAYLVCGANTAKGYCASLAGQGTDHLGYGPCKLHNGNIASKDEMPPATLHGFYRQVLLPHEREYFDAAAKEKPVDHIHQAIYTLSAKIVTYLATIRQKYEKALADKSDSDEARKALNVTARKVSESEHEDGIEISTTVITYEAGTIEDRHLMQALDKLGRLVERAAKLDPNGAGNVVDEINKELRAASHGKVTLSWGNRKAQERRIPTE